MSIESFEKQEWESWPVWGSIVNAQTATEEVDETKSFVRAMDSEGNNVSSTFLDQSTIAKGTDPDGSYSNNMLGMRCQGGSLALSPYYITFYIWTTENNKYEVDVKVKIKRIPTSPIPVTTTTTT